MVRRNYNVAAQRFDLSYLRDLPHNVNRLKPSDPGELQYQPTYG
jgi:hypothetical protein